MFSLQKYCIGSILLFFGLFTSFAQTSPFNKIEYFIDQDPKAGNETLLILDNYVNNLTDFPIEITETNQLSTGLHTLNVRVQDSLGQWSMLESMLFSVDSVQKVVQSNTSFPFNKIEYFIDTDPGTGKGTIISLPNYVNDLTDFPIEITETNQLSTGLHSLNIRVQDSLGQWNMLESMLFSVDSVQKIVHSNTSFPFNKIEYFIDTDPGIGKGTTISLPNYVNELTDFPIEITETNQLSTGLHSLNIRIQDSLGQWNMLESMLFSVDSVQKVVHSNTSFPFNKIEYFIDTDPGFGKGTSISFPNYVDSLTDFSLEISETNDLDLGLHTLNIRAQDSLGQWSLLESSYFKVDSIVFNPQENDSLSQFIGFEYYFDTLNNIPSTGIYHAFDKPLKNLEDFDFEIPSTPALSVGEHQVSLRFKQLNGSWSQTFSKPFEVCLFSEEPPKSVVGNTLCKGAGYAAVSASGSESGKYSWYREPSGGSPINSQTDSLYFQWFTKNTTLYVASKGAVCHSNRIPVQVTIWDHIQEPSIQSIIHCGPDSFLLAPTGKPVAGTYYWYSSDTSQTPIYKGNVYPVYIDSTKILYMSSVTSDKKCESDKRTNVIIAIKECLPQNIVFPKPKNVVFGTDKGQKLTAYSQNSSGNKTGLPISYEIIEGKNYAFLQNDSVYYKGIGTVKIKASQEGDSTNIYYAAVDVIQSFSIVASATDVIIEHNSPICAGEKLSLSPTVVNNALYLWEGPNGFTSTKRVVNILPITQADSGLYKLQVINVFDTLYSSVSVKVKPSTKQIYLQVEEVTKCGEKSVEFQATGGDFKIFNWFLNGAKIVTSNNDNYIPLFTGVYHVLAIDSNSCSSVSSPSYVDLTPDVLPKITYSTDSNSLKSSNAMSYQWYINDLFIVDATLQTLPVISNGIYKVKTTTNEGCTYISLPFEMDESFLPTIDFSRKQSIYLNDFSPKEQMWVAPNPINNFVNIYLKYTSPNATLQIISSQGMVVYEIFISNEKRKFTIPANELSNGFYIVHLIGENFHYQSTFIK